MNQPTTAAPNAIRRDLADTLEEIGQALGLLREADDELTNGNPGGAQMCADDALEILAALEATYSALAARLAIFSEARV